MNTPQSMALGWGSLVAAAGVSYYFAKQSIDERRKTQEAAGSRPVEKLDWRARIAQQPGQPNAGTGEANSSVLSSASAKTGITNVKNGS